MREIWGPAWFASALCAIVVIAVILGAWQAAAPAFFCFLPVVFFQMTRTIQKLSSRVEELERSH
jgi:hypothetical protein